MFKLGLTGSIATGKSAALDAFAALGHPTFSADDAVHALYHGRALIPLAEIFPETVHGNQIDRTILGAILAREPGRIKQLEAIVHPMVREEMANFFARAEACGARLAVIAIPLLYETGFDHGLNAVALTFCDEAQLRSRALARPGMDVEKLNILLARQLGQDEKKRRADYLIDTSNSIEQMQARVKQIAAGILSAPNK